MDKKLYYIELFDCYQSLLTDKQREYFMDYYFDDLSLSEIGENGLVSRNAVSKQLKDTIYKLEHYEEKLHLLSKKREFRVIIEETIDKRIKEKLEKLL